MNAHIQPHIPAANQSRQDSPGEISGVEPLDDVEVRVAASSDGAEDVEEVDVYVLLDSLSSSE